jgi:hypothetical protein
MGVLYYKAPHKSSSSGNEFSVWKLTDLREAAQLGNFQSSLFLVKDDSST